MGFEVVISSENCTSWEPSEGRIDCILPQSLYFPPNWGASLLEYSFDGGVLNVVDCSFIYDKKGGRKKIKLINSHFDEVTDLLDEIKFLSGKDEVKFVIAGSTIACHFPKDVSLFLNEPLRRILGFDEPLLTDGSSNSLGWNLWTSVPSISVQWKFLAKRISGENYLNSLKTLSGLYKNIPYGKCTHERIPEASVEKLDVREVGRISLNLITGREEEPVRFPKNSHVLFVLRFSAIE